MSAEIRHCAELIFGNGKLFTGSRCQRPAKVQEGRKWWCAWHSRAGKRKAEARRASRRRGVQAVTDARLAAARNMQRRSKHYAPLRDALMGLVEVCDEGDGLAYTEAVRTLAALEEAKGWA